MVLSPPKGVSVSKVVTYAVLIPAPSTAKGLYFVYGFLIIGVEWCYAQSFLFFIFCLVIAGCWLIWRFNQEHVYQQILDRLQAESRAAQVLVTAVNYDEATTQYDHHQIR